MNKGFVIDIREYERIGDMCSYNETVLKSKSKDIEEHYIKIVGDDYDDCNFCIYEVDEKGNEITFIGTGYTSNYIEYSIEFKYYQT